MKKTADAVHERSPNAVLLSKWLTVAASHMPRYRLWFEDVVWCVMVSVRSVAVVFTNLIMRDACSMLCSKACNVQSIALSS